VVSVDTVSPCSTASIVARMRGSSAGRNPTIGSIRLEASRASVPKYWVNEPAESLQPFCTTVSKISSRVRFQSSTRWPPSMTSAMAIARSSATQHISLE